MLPLSLSHASLCHIVNCSIIAKVFPNVWKVAKITPLFKKDEKEPIDNYRSVSILCWLSKILERHVHKHLYDYLIENNPLHSTHSGFRPNYSCATFLKHMTDNWLRAIDSRQMVGVVLVDLQKALDSVHHFLLLDKLNLYACSQNATIWFGSYLLGRLQYVCLNSACFWV